MSAEATRKKRAIRALERRFGQSVLLYSMKQIGSKMFKLTDPETGSWIRVAFSGPSDRLTVVEEHDGRL